METIDIAVERFALEGVSPGRRLSDFSGEDYRSCLTQIHDLLKPKNYLEIGTHRGDSLKLARCAALAIDPQFQFSDKFPTESMPSLCLFQMRSNTFFASHDPEAILGGPIDFAFLDGLHLVEALLSDFMNTEKFCHRQSLIVLHDCVPLDLHMAGRDVNDSKRRSASAHPHWWTGDVWKILPILRRYRPDLTVKVFNAPPTGLVLVSGLDPKSGVLTQHYDEIIAEFRKPVDEEAMFAAVIADLTLQDTTRLVDSVALLRYLS